MAAGIALTNEEIKDIRLAAHRVWNAIAHDIFTALEEQGEPNTLPRAHVIELICDADRLRQELAKTNRPLADKVRDMIYKQLVAILKPAFPHEHYE